MTFRNRPLRNEVDLCPHQEDLDPDAKYFFAVDGSATEKEYLNLLRVMIELFKPTSALETGSYMGDGTYALLKGLSNGPFDNPTLITICGDELPQAVEISLNQTADISEINLQMVTGNTINFIEQNQLAELTKGETTFAFLDSSIPDRLKEFEHISNPDNKVLDFTRPLCVCVHDMSAYRHPKDCHSEFLQETVEGLTKLATERGWQLLRLNQSRGMIILVKYPL